MSEPVQILSSNYFDIFLQQSLSYVLYQTQDVAHLMISNQTYFVEDFFIND